MTLTSYQWHLGLTTIYGYTLAYNDYQAAMLAVNYVHASYYGQITANMNVNAYYNGYYWGYLDGTAAVVIDM